MATKQVFEKTKTRTILGMPDLIAFQNGDEVLPSEKLANATSKQRPPRELSFSDKLRRHSQLETELENIRDMHSHWTQVHESVRPLVKRFEKELAKLDKALEQSAKIDSALIARLQEKREKVVHSLKNESERLGRADVLVAKWQKHYDEFPMAEYEVLCELAKLADAAEPNRG